MNCSFETVLNDRKFTVIYIATESRYKQTQTDPASDPEIEIEQIEESGDIVNTTIDNKTYQKLEHLAYVHYCENK